jgi:hypothetical protein
VNMTPHRRSRYIGLDVHRATIAVAIAEEEGAPTSYGTIANDPPAIRKLMARLGGQEVRLRVECEQNWKVPDEAPEKGRFSDDIRGSE